MAAISAAKGRCRGGEEEEEYKVRDELMIVPGTDKVHDHLIHLSFILRIIIIMKTLIECRVCTIPEASGWLYGYSTFGLVRARHRCTVCKVCLSTNKVTTRSIVHDCTTGTHESDRTTRLSSPEPSLTLPPLQQS